MVSLKNYAITFCVALVIFGLLALFLAPIAVNSLGGSAEEGVNAELETGDAEGEDPERKPIDLSNIKGQSFTVLLLGVDYLPDALNDYDSVFDSSVVNYGEKTLGDGSLLSDDDIPKSSLTYQKYRKTTCDTIMVVQFNRERQSVTAISIPSNTRVMIDGNNVSLGRVLPKKGITFFREKVQALTGVKIDHYMLLTPKLFVNTINALGGVPFDVPQDMFYEDPVEDMTIDLKQGRQTLTGSAALAMLRYVGYADGDLGRMKLARSFIHNILSQMDAFCATVSPADRFATLIPFIYSDLNASIFAEEQDLIFCYKDFVKEELTYPGQQVTLGSETYYEPDVASATAMFAEYRLDND